MKKEERLRRNVALGYAHAVLSAGFSIPGPTLFLYWQSKGVSVGQASVLEGVFCMTLASASVGGGVVAQQTSRKATIVAGSCFLAIAAAVYLIAKNFQEFLLAETALALGFSLFAGSGQALVTDSLEELGEAIDVKTKVLSNLRMISYFVWMLGPLIGGLLGRMDPRMPLLVAFLFMSGAIIVSLLMTEPSRSIDAGTTINWASLRGVLGETLMADRKVRKLLLVSATLAGVLYAAAVLFPLYFRACGLGETGLGIMAMLGNGMALFGSKKVGRLRERMTERSLLSLPALLISTGYGMMSLGAELWFALFAMSNHLGRGIVETHLLIDIDTRASGPNKALVLAIKNGLDWTMRSIAVVTFGIFSGILGVSWAFLILSILSILVVAYAFQPDAKSKQI